MSLFDSLMGKAGTIDLGADGEGAFAGIAGKLGAALPFGGIGDEISGFASKLFGRE